MERLSIWVKNMEKRDIRQEIFKRRREHSPEWIAATSERICDRILDSEEFKQASTVYAYMDCKGEVSMKKLLEACWEQGKTVAVPKVLGEDMKYYVIRGYGDTSPGYFQVPEPDTGEEAGEEKALLIVPGVAFDPSRHRCGYGKGFYDRYLIRHPEHPTIAAAFDFQVVDQVPADPHDICPHRLVTETKDYCAGKKEENVC